MPMSREVWGGALERSKLAKEDWAPRGLQGLRQGITFQSDAGIWVYPAAHRKGRILVRAELIVSKYAPAWLHQLLKY